MLTDSATTELDRWLSNLPSDQARLVYVSAVPLRLDIEILMELHGSREQAVSAIQILEEHLLITPVSHTRFIVRPEERRHLIRVGWNGKLGDYPNINQRMADYCLRQLVQVTDHTKRFSWARAALYHQLASKQTSGWQQLAQWYEDAEARGLSGTASQLLEPLRELRPLLSPEERSTLVYFRARAAFLAGESRKAECLFRAVIAGGKPFTIVGVAHRGLGKVLAARQHWSEALKHFRQSDAVLRRSLSRDPLSLALTQASIGDMYQEMAEFSGGIVRIGSSPPQGGLPSWARTLIQLPIRLYLQAGHLVQRLPFIDIGFSYQNWITARLMLAAESSYRRAIRMMASKPSPQTLYEARLGLARVYTRIGMQRRAKQILDVLVQSEYVNESEFRQAQINFHRAELAEARQEYDMAEKLLQQIIHVYVSYRQRDRLAVIYQRLGNLATLRGDAQAGVEAYKKAVSLFEETGQILSRTTVLDKISQASDITPSTYQRDYIAPFPTRLGRLFRRLIYFGMGILFLLGLLLALISVLIISITEFSILQGFRIVTAATLMLLWPLISVWLLQVIYLSLGLIISFLLPIKTLEKDSPLRVSLDENVLSISGGENPEPSSIAWETIDQIQVVEYQLRSVPIELFSYLHVFSQKQRWRIPALTIGYPNLSEGVTRYIADTKLQRVTFKLIAHPLNYLVSVLLIPIGVIFQKTAEFGVSGLGDPSEFTLTNISGIILGTFLAGLLFYPLIIFWRLVIHRWQLQHDAPYKFPLPSLSVLLYTLTVLWTLLAFIFLRYIYTYI